MTEDDVQAAALIDLTDDLQDAADSEVSFSSGGCLSLVVILILIWLSLS